MGKTDEIIAEVAQGVADRLIAAIEAGIADPDAWEAPWQAFTQPQRNPLSGYAYHGINPLILAYVQAERGYKRPLWVTFNQQKAAGGHLVDAKGKGVRLIRWIVSLSCTTHGTGKYNRVTSQCCDNVRKYQGMTTFTVFNIEHVEGIEFPDDDAIVRNEIESVEAIEAFVAALGVDLRHADQNRAYHSPAGNYIMLPSRDLFHSVEGYYSTLLHEITHWSGSEGRSERTKGGRFGDHKYAMEELVAELGSAMLMHHFNLEAEPSMDHANYLRNWLGALREDASYLYHAAQQASHAVQWLLSNGEAKARAA